MRRSAPKALASALHPGGSPPKTYTLEYSHNVASITIQTGPNRIRITFTDALASTDYVVMVNGITSTANPDQLQLLDRQLTHCDIAIYDGAVFLSQLDRLMVAIFRG